MLFPGMGRLSENSVVSIKNKSFSVTAEIVAPVKDASGVLIAQGGRFGGWSLYAHAGKAKFVYNVLGIHSYEIEATQSIPAGEHQVRNVDIRFHRRRVHFVQHPHHRVDRVDQRQRKRLEFQDNFHAEVAGIFAQLAQRVDGQLPLLGRRNDLR